MPLYRNATARNIVKQTSTHEIVIKRESCFTDTMIKKVLSILGIISAIAAVEIFRAFTGIPVTLLDILLFPISVVFIVAMGMLLFEKENKNKKKHKKQNAASPEINLSWMKRLGYIVLSLMMLALGAWAVSAGIEQPFKLFTGVKGASHGYTLVALGICIVIMGLMMLYQFIFKTHSDSQTGE